MFFNFCWSSKKVKEILIIYKVLAHNKIYDDILEKEEISGIIITIKTCLIYRIYHSNVLQMPDSWESLAKIELSLCSSCSGE